MIPDALTAALLPDEEVLWWAQPIRPAGGHWVWATMILGVAFGGACAGAFVDAITAPSLALGALIFCALLAPFSILLILWPFLAYRGLRKTYVAVTNHAVVRLRGARLTRHLPGTITTPHIARRRGKSASIVLSEDLTNKNDGTPVYRWVALHGLPDAEAGLAAIEKLKARAQGTSSSSSGKSG